MNSLQIRKLDKYQRESAFMQDNATDFSRDSPGDKAAKRFTEVITLIQTLAAQQTSQQVSQNLGIKDESFARMTNLCKQINRTGHALGEEIESLETLFRLPRRRSEAIWLATARAFQRDSAPYESEMQEYIKTPSFRDALQTLIDAVEQAMLAADITGEQKGGATGGLTGAFREAGMLSRRLNAIIQNKYDDNAQKLAAWAIASHLEATPKRSNGNGGQQPNP